MPLAFAKTKFYTMATDFFSLLRTLGVFRKNGSSLISKLSDVAGSYAENYLKQVTGSGATQRDVDLSKLSLENQQILNAEAWQRQLDYTEEYETYEAQVRHMKNAGVNPALMYQGAGSPPSSGTAPVGSAGASASGAGALGSLLSGILSAAGRFKQIETDKDLETRRLDLQERQQKWMERYYNSISEGNEQKNSVFFEAFGLDMMYKQALTDKTLSDKERNEVLNRLSEAQTNYFNEIAQTEPFKRRMIESGIDLNVAQKGLIGVETAIRQAMLKHTDKYYGALAKIQALQAAEFEWTHNNIFAKTHQKMYDAAVAELTSVILKAGYDAKAFTYMDKMSPKDWTKLIGGLLGVTIGTAGHVAGSMIRSAGRVAGAAMPPMLWTPNMNYQFYSSTGYRPDEFIM